MGEDVQMATEFSSPRSFQLWDYRVSHAQLLIRSPKGAWGSADQAQNLDLMFLGVAHMDCAATLRGVSVVQASTHELGALASRAGIQTWPSYRLFRLESENHRHHIVASSLTILRTTSEIMESSLVLHFSLKDGESERYRALYLV
jgi:hypothetical protein